MGERIPNINNVPIPRILPAVNRERASPLCSFGIFSIM